jgi:hypothetical protein
MLSTREDNCGEVWKRAPHFSTSQLLIDSSYVG